MCPRIWVSLEELAVLQLVIDCSTAEKPTGEGMLYLPLIRYPGLKKT